MNIDFQFLPDVFANALRGAFASEMNARGVVVPGVFVPRDPETGDPGNPTVFQFLEIDSVDLVRATWRPPVAVGIQLPTSATIVEARPILARVVVRLEPVTVAQLVDAGEEAFSASASLYARVGIQLDVQMDGGRPVLGLRFDGDLELSLLSDRGFGGPETYGVGPGDLSGIEDALADLPSFPLDVESISDLVAGYRVRNAGLSLSDDALTIRLQVEPETIAFGPFTSVLDRLWTATWAAFHDEGPPSRLGTLDFGVFLPASVLSTSVQQQVDDALSDGGDLRLDAQHSTWGVDDSGAFLRSDLNLTALGACDPFGDLAIDATLTTRFSIPRSGVLRANVHLDFKTDEAETLLCAWTVGSIAHALGGASVLALLSTFGFILGVIDAEAGGKVPSLDSLQPVPGSDRDFFQEFEVGDLAPLSLGRGATTTSVGSQSGLVIGGSLTPWTHMPALLDIVDVNDFMWAALGTRCPVDRTQLGARATIQVANRRRVDDPDDDEVRIGTLPLVVGHVQFLDGTPSAIRRSNIQPRLPTSPLNAGSAARNLHIGVPVEAVEAALAASGGDVVGPARVLVQTTGGSRIITLAGLTPDLDSAALDVALRLQQLRCENRLIRMRGSRFRFAIDPVGPRSIGPVLWRLRATGLRRGAAIQVALAASNAPVVARADARGLVDGRWIQARASGDGSAEIHVDDDAVTREDARIAVSRSAYETVASIPIATGLIAHALGNLGGRPVLAAVSPARLQVFDLSTPTRPRLVLSRRTGEVRGCTISRDRVYLYGPSGLQAHALSVPSVHLVDEAVIDALVVPGGLAYASEDVVGMIRAQGKQRLLEIDKPTRLLLTRDGLLVRSEQGLHACKVSSRARSLSLMQSKGHDIDAELEQAWHEARQTSRAFPVLGELSVTACDDAAALEVHVRTSVATD
jgi:hypothetical protein